MGPIGRIWRGTWCLIFAGLVFHFSSPAQTKPKAVGKGSASPVSPTATRPAAPGKDNAPAAKTSNDQELERVLSEMDAAAERFRSAQATFVWEHFQKVVEESDSQNGRIYFRRTGGEVQMAADITQPDPKYLLLSEGKVQLYQPKIEQVTVYNMAKYRDQVESFLLLGFGAGGHEMLKSYDVKYLGTAKLGDANTANLDLVPKPQSMRNKISHIALWIDPAKGVSLQQQIFEPSGDYRLTKYSDIQLNQKLPESAFKLKTTGKTKFVSP